ncbi:complement factor D-like isoform X2 [Cimex lectularius]|nr:complement factor D-like isoform X2 [Cimex lectularius]
MTTAQCFFNDVREIVDPGSVMMFWKDKTGFDGWRATNLIPHPAYRLGSVHCNIGLAKTSGVFPSVYKNLGGHLEHDKPCEIFGYGSYDRGFRLPLYLQRMKVAPENRKTCNEVNESLICITFKNKEMPCNGDSGAPLICEGSVKGILSDGYVSREMCGIFRKSLTRYQILANYRLWLNEITGVFVESHYKSASYHHILIPLCLCFVFFNNIVKIH